MAQQVDASPTNDPAVVCSRCGAKTRLIWRSPLPAELKGEMRVFECQDCGKQTKIVVGDQTTLKGQ